MNSSGSTHSLLVRGVKTKSWNIGRSYWPSKRPHISNCDTVNTFWSSWMSFNVFGRCLWLRWAKECKGETESVEGIDEEIMDDVANVGENRERISHFKSTHRFTFQSVCAYWLFQVEPNKTGSTHGIWSKCVCTKSWNSGVRNCHLSLKTSTQSKVWNCEYFLMMISWLVVARSIKDVFSSVDSAWMF